MEIAELLDALRRQGESLADAAERAGLAAAVPPCTPWQVKDLLRHTGYVHRWAARHVTECPDQIIDGPSEEEILRGGTDDAGLLAWFRAGHAALADTVPVPVEPRRRRPGRRHHHRRPRTARRLAVQRPRPLGLTG